MGPEAMPPGDTTGGNPSSDRTEAGRPYESSAVAGAVLLTIFAPFVSLVAALLLHGSERDPARKRQLGTWAAISGVYLAVGFLVGVMVFASIASGPHRNTRGPCIGGPALGVPAEPLGDGRYRQPCAISGSEIIRFDEEWTPSP